MILEPDQIDQMNEWDAKLELRRMIKHHVDSRVELATLRAKAEAYDKQQLSVAEYDKEMEANVKQVEGWKRKAEAYDKGKTTFAVTPITAPKVITATGPTTGLAWEKARQFLGMMQNGNKVDGYTCRKVRVCEVVG